jgi:2-oxo-4-hydroxy-4-carboxy--5-ureidoimidazoline (OHCU) decarboxylase
MFKKFIMNKMMQRQLKDLPEDQREKMMNAMKENPDLFEKIALEVQSAVKAGRDQTTAALEVAQKYRKELAEILQK